MSGKANFKLRIALLHIAPKGGAVSYNRSQIRRALAVAAGYEADLAITPELAESGVEFFSEIDIRTIPFFPSPFIYDLREVARKYSMNIIVGLPEKSREEGLYNALVVITKDGTLQGTYRKIHSGGPLEENWALSGEELATQDINDLTIGFMIGQDVYSQGMPKALKKMGAKLIIGLEAYPFGDINNEWVMRSREVDIPIIVCNRTGREENLNFSKGESLVISGGKCCYAFAPREPKVIIIDWDTKKSEFEFIAALSLRIK